MGEKLTVRENENSNQKLAVPRYYKEAKKSRHHRLNCHSCPSFHLKHRRHNDYIGRCCGDNQLIKGSGTSQTHTSLSHHELLLT
ncbi:hypothetical protein E2C01_063991 [Portunus trituberculatus]|uniref:Uncharacterized protein n=1 Tax=Portunus trituberculatus TaxID=210409 RepID=A0A5B7HBY1_PORTR|nr:hypothetical protein [Portunus trituberculatus]